MPAEFYSGNTKGTGGALFVNFNSKDQAVYFRIVKQTGWNEKANKPTFAGGEQINVKLSPDEVGDIIHAVSGHDVCGFVHQSSAGSTTGSFRYYEIDDVRKPGNKKRGFGLTVKKGESEVRIGFPLGAGERLSQYLQFALEHIFNAIYAEDKKEAEEWRKKKDVQNKPKVVETPASSFNNDSGGSDDLTAPELVEDTIPY